MRPDERPVWACYFRSPNLHPLLSSVVLGTYQAAATRKLYALHAGKFKDRDTFHLNLRSAKLW